MKEIIIKDKSNKTLTAFHKVNDWYSKHNFGTRFAMIVFVLLYAVSVLSTLDLGTVTENVDKESVENTIETIKKITEGKSNYEIVEITGYLAFFAFLVITLGDNGLNKVIDLIKTIKGVPVTPTKPKEKQEPIERKEPTVSDTHPNYESGKF